MSHRSIQPYHFLQRAFFNTIFTQTSVNILAHRTPGLPCTRTWGTASGCCRWAYTGTWPARDTLNSWQAETSVQSLTPRAHTHIHTPTDRQSTPVFRHSLRATRQLHESRGSWGGGSVLSAGRLPGSNVFERLHDSARLTRLKRRSVAKHCHVVNIF